MDQQSENSNNMNLNAEMFYSPVMEEPSTDYFTSPLNNEYSTPYDVFDFTTHHADSFMVGDDSHLFEPSSSSEPTVIQHYNIPAPNTCSGPKQEVGLENITMDALFNQHSSTATAETTTLPSSMLGHGNNNNNHDNDQALYSSTLPAVNDSLAFKPLSNPLSSSSLFFSTLGPLQDLDLNPKTPSVNTTRLFSTSNPPERKSCKRKKEELQEEDYYYQNNTRQGSNNAIMNSREEDWCDEGEKERKQRRLMKNRESAQKSRLRKKRETEAIERRNEQLEGQNAILEQDKVMIIEEWDNVFKSINQYASNLDPMLFADFQRANQRVQARKSSANFSNSVPNFSAYVKKS